MMHDQHVESLAKKLRKASVDPKKLKEKANTKGKNQTGKNANANAKKGENAWKLQQYKLI